MANKPLTLTELRKRVAALESQNTELREMVKSREHELQHLHKIPPKTSALEVQVGGSHYKDMAIQPVEYILANNLGFIEGNIVKYASRWKDKGGIKDLEKIQHFAQLLIEDTQSKQEDAQGTDSGRISSAENICSNSCKPLGIVRKN